MLAFIIPLKSPKVSTSWEAISKLFERSIRSVCNQNSSNFQAIVVCNEKPQIQFSHPHITYIEVDFPLPRSDLESKDFDRERKVLRGLNYARQLGASHVMIVDADDCVSKHLAEFVSDRLQENGWLIRRGYWYKDGSKYIKIMRKGFDRYCGTSTIIKTDLYNLPEQFTEEELTWHIYKYYRHREIKNTLEKRGKILDTLPFAGAVYIKHGENLLYGQAQTPKISIKSRILRLKAFLDYRILTPAIREEFSLYDLA